MDINGVTLIISHTLCTLDQQSGTEYFLPRNRLRLLYSVYDELVVLTMGLYGVLAAIGAKPSPAKLQYIRLR